MITFTQKTGAKSRDEGSGLLDTSVLAARHLQGVGHDVIVGPTRAARFLGCARKPPRYSTLARPR